MSFTRPTTPTAMDLINASKELEKLEKMEKDLKTNLEEEGIKENIKKEDREDIILKGEDVINTEAIGGAIPKLHNINNITTNNEPMNEGRKNEMESKIEKINGFEDYTLLEMAKEIKQLKKMNKMLTDHMADNSYNIKEEERGVSFAELNSKIKEIEKILSNNQAEFNKMKNPPHIFNECSTHIETMMPTLIKNDSQKIGPNKNIKDFLASNKQVFNCDQDFDQFLYLFLSSIKAFPLLTEHEFCQCLIRSMGPKAISKIPIVVLEYGPRDLLFYLCSTYGKISSKTTKMQEFAAYTGQDATNIKDLINKLSNLAKHAQVTNVVFIEKFLHTVPPRVEDYFVSVLNEYQRTNGNKLPEDFKPEIFLMKNLDNQPSYNVDLNKIKKVNYDINNLIITEEEEKTPEKKEIGNKRRGDDIINSEATGGTIPRLTNEHFYNNFNF